MKKLLIPAATLMLALVGCATQSDTAPATQATPAQPEAAAPAAQAPVDSIDGKKEVAYRCGAKSNDPLRVMYGFQGDDVVVAQVLYKGQPSPVLYRDRSDQDGNAFTSDSGITWSALPANAANVDKVDGNMLTQPGKQMVNGKETVITEIVTKYCELDKKETAKLQQAAPK